MRNFLAMCLFIMLSNAALCQIVSLNANEIKTLKSNLKTENSYKEVNDQLEKTTANYLNDVPNPVDTILSEGLLQGHPKKVKTIRALKDMDKMFALALQYRLSGEKSYLNKSIEFLLAWANKNRGNGNPINDTKIDKAVEAYDLIKKDIPTESKKTIENWLSETAWAEINSKRMNSGRGSAINNWNAHRLKVVGEIGYALGNQKLIDWTIAHLKTHIAINLNADGTSLDFKERDAMHYHIYDLEPMLKLAIMIDRAKGPDFYSYESPQGASIKKSVEWLLPYIKGEKQHEEYVHTKVAFDRARAKNNEAGFAPGTMFKPMLALPVLQLSVYFDQSQKDLLAGLQQYENVERIINRIKAGHD